MTEAMDPWTRALEREEERQRALDYLRIYAKNSDSLLANATRLALEEVDALRVQVKECVQEIHSLEARLGHPIYDQHGSRVNRG